MKVRDAIALQRQHGISGLPVVEGGKLVGIVTNRDLRFEENLDQPLRNIMTPQDRLVTMKEGATLDEAQALMHKHRLERVLIVNDGFELRGLATVRTSSRTPSIRSPTRTPWASCAWARRWAWAPAPKSASRSWSPRALTC